MTTTTPTYGYTPPVVRKVLMSDQLMEALVGVVSHVEGAKVTLDWGEPDAGGFYTPTLTITNEQPEPLKEGVFP